MLWWIDQPPSEQPLAHADPISNQKPRKPMQQHRWSILTGAAMAALVVCLPARHPQAQTQSQQQFVVIYGEFRPDPRCISEGTSRLDHLARLAHQSAGI